MPDITIIVPFYQTNKVLFKQCINSILENKDADIELLIIDDGSTKKHHSTTDYFLTDPRVRVFHRPHKGVSAARNYGIEKATATWIMFIDSDDYLESGWYTEVKPYLNNAEDLIIFNGYKNSDGIQKKNQYFLKEGIDYGGSKELKTMVMESALTIGLLPRGYLSYYSLGSPCSKLFKTCFLKNNGLLFDETISFAEDTLFSLNMLIKARSIIYIDKYLYHYIMHGSSATHRYRQGLSDEIKKFLYKVNLMLIENNIKDRMEFAYLNRAFREMNRAIRQEFFHKDNHKSLSEKNREANRFVANKTFQYALKRGIRGEYGIIERIESILIKYKMYTLMTKVRTLLQNNQRITALVLSLRRYGRHSHTYAKE